MIIEISINIFFLCFQAFQLNVECCPTFGPSC